MPLTKDEVKQALKEAHKEWLDENFSVIGRRVVNWALSVILGVIAYSAIFLSGWRK
ncbi:MAG: hypothetical protein PHF58_10625 [Methylotenera sp.]|nr:hypothetical protein [Methylotenera sp.]